MGRLLPSLIFATGLAAATPAFADFAISFTWGDIPRCTTGRPGTVPSPRFEVTGLPAGADRIEFRLTDLDVPGYPHGGGAVAVSGDGVIPPGAFSYRSPCPPGGVHTYEWSANAMAGDETLGTATARRDYPE